MTTLVLRLAGPMQSWGTRSRFAYRSTDPQPSKSAVLGLLAAAQGRRRTEAVEDLAGLRFGVRVDQPGQVVRDFQTARTLHSGDPMPLTHRYYLCDAVFVAAVEGAPDLVGALADAVRRPVFPLFLGRRSCPPAQPLYVDVVDRGLRDVLTSVAPGVGTPWAAAPWWRERQDTEVTLDVVRDADPDEPATDVTPDVPVSYDPQHRRYATRPVVHDTCVVPNPRGVRRRSALVTFHDPLALIPGEA